jgi:hypothetical protein
LWRCKKSGRRVELVGGVFFAREFLGLRRVGENIHWVSTEILKIGQKLFILI